MNNILIGGAVLVTLVVGYSVWHSQQLQQQQLQLQIAAQQAAIARGAAGQSPTGDGVANAVGEGLKVINTVLDNLMNG